MTSAHPTGDLLLDYATGGLSTGLSLILACHLTFCPRCRTMVARLEAVGGAMLADAPEAQPPAAALEAVLSRVDAVETGAVLQGDPALPLPAPLRRELTRGGTAIRWRFRLPGVSECPLPGFARDAVSLLRAGPGVRIPAHTHSGQEATLILAGAMRDGDRSYLPGDLALAGDHDAHRPEIVGSRTCFCLVSITGRRRFTGPFGRALNLFER